MTPNASIDEIEAAFRAKGKERDPDTGGDADAFRETQNAYSTLVSTSHSEVGDNATVRLTTWFNGIYGEWLWITFGFAFLLTT